MTVVAPGDDANRLAELRMQRALLVRIADDMAASQRRLKVPADGSWRSNAQREFARALGDVDEMLHSAWRALDAAIADIDSDVATLVSTVSFGVK